MKKPNVAQVVKKVKEYFWVTLGAMLNAISVYVFVNPAKLVAGGFTGLSSAITWIIYSSNNTLNFDNVMSIVYFMMNIPLLICSLILLRGDFTFKTIWATLSCTLFLALFPAINFPKFEDGYARIISIIFGGMLLGFAMHIAAINNGSNGGTEIIAKIVNKYKPEVDLSKVLLILNWIITISGSIIVMIFAGTNIWTIVYSLIYVWIGATCMDVFSRGLDHPQKYMIVTKNPQPIADEITQKFQRGLTILDVEDNNGSLVDNKMIMVIVQYRQATLLQNIIRKHDDSAFVFVKDMHYIFSRPSFNRSYKTK